MKKFEEHIEDGEKYLNELVAKAETGDKDAYEELKTLFACQIMETMCRYYEAAKEGNLSAMVALGDMYAHPDPDGPVGTDYTAAFDLYYKAASAGSAWGIQRLAECYICGMGVRKDLENAKVWADKLQTSGDPEGSYASLMDRIDHADDNLIEF